MRLQRSSLFALLLTVAAAAAVLSFSALRDLALVCGFDARLAWLLPVVVDAGAAAGSLVWLGSWAPEPARRFARVLALLLLGGSVAGNALGHGLEAFRVAAPWWVVVTVSAVAPAVLGAVVHLAVLASGRIRESTTEEAGAPPTALATPGASVSVESGDELLDRARVLVADGAGRPTVAKELAITDYEARRLVERVKASTNGVAV